MGRKRKEGNLRRIRKGKREEKEVGHVVELKRKRGNIRKRKKERKLVAAGVEALRNTVGTGVEAEVGAVGRVTGEEGKSVKVPVRLGHHTDAIAGTGPSLGVGMEVGDGQGTSQERDIGVGQGEGNPGTKRDTGTEATRVDQAIGIAVDQGVGTRGVATTGRIVRRVDQEEAVDGDQILIAGAGATVETMLTDGTDTNRGHVPDQEPQRGPRSVTDLDP